jgi:hypothetical protein
MLSFAAAGCRTVQIRTVVQQGEHDFRDSLLAQKSRLFQGFSCCFWAVLFRPYSKLLAQFSRHCFLEDRTAVRIWHEFQGRNCGGQIWCCEVFFLAENCELAADMYFPEAE